MSWAINIKSTNSSSAHISNLWDKVSDLESSPSMKKLNYPPHFTFAIYDEIDPYILRKVTKEVFENRSSITITFDQIGIFDAEAFVIWASPLNRSELIEIHGDIHSRISKNICREYYRPNSWVPHCTLGINVPPENKNTALKMAGKLANPFDVTFDCGDCVEFLPVRIIDEHKL